MRKGRHYDHIIQFGFLNHQEDQSAQFHNQVAGEIFCPLQGSTWPLMVSVQNQVFNLFLNIESSSALRYRHFFSFGF